MVELSELLFSLLPKHYSHAIYTNSGSEANEVLIRTVRRYWQVVGKPSKTVMIGRWNGYHGSTLGSRTATRPGSFSTCSTIGYSA